VNKTPNAAPAPVDGMVLVSGELLREIADEMRANADSDAGAGRLSRLTLMWAHGLETLIAAAPTSGQWGGMPYWRSPDGRILSEEAVRFDGTDTTGWARLAAPTSAATPGGQGYGDWRPISTAPRDGTVISLRVGSDGCTPGWWNGDVDEHTPHPWSFFDSDSRGHTVVSTSPASGVRHWRPYEVLAQPVASAAPGAVDDAREAGFNNYAARFTMTLQILREHGNAGLVAFVNELADAALAHPKPAAGGEDQS
jgi:hypothetical protein